MSATALIAARVTPEVKAHVCALAQRQNLTESAFLRRLIDLTQPPSIAVDIAGESAPPKLGRQVRVTIRMRDDDHMLLRERAMSRDMRAATYVSVLLRAHLRHLAPLPRSELLALKRSVAELGAIGRLLNQIARASSAGRDGTPSRVDLSAMLRVSEALRDHVKALIRANTRTWDTGHAEMET